MSILLDIYSNNIISLILSFLKSILAPNSFIELLISILSLIFTYEKRY